MTKRFSLSSEAASDIREIWAYIANDNVRAARKVRLQIMDACERLAQNPAIGHSREDLTERAVKFWLVGSYLIVYDPEKRPVEIVRVLHGALDIPASYESAETGVLSTIVDAPSVRTRRSSSVAG